MLAARDIGRPLSEIDRPRIPAFMPPGLSSYGNWGLGPGIPGTIGSNAWPAANRALFSPVRVPYPVTVDQLICGTGTLTAGNFDLGIYDESGTRMVSTGTTAKTTASSERVVDVTDTLLQPGLYYVAMATDGTQNYVMAAGTVGTHPRLIGCRQMDTAFPLPATATFATMTDGRVPVVAAILARAKIVETPSWRWPPLNVITPQHPDSLGMMTRGPAAGQLLASASLAVPTANLAYFYKFTMYEAATAVKMSMLIGAGTTGNLDVAIYDAATLARLVVLGATALGTANTVQELNIADTPLAPGEYLMACQFSSTSGSFFRNAPLSDEVALTTIPLYTQAVGSFGLPDPAVPAITAEVAPAMIAMGVHFNSLL